MELERTAEPAAGTAADAVKNEAMGTAAETDVKPAEAVAAAAGQPKKKNPQMSDSFLVCVLLSLSGGGMDAYSYLCRGQVFANAQTGNLLLFGTNLAQGQFAEAFRYFLPALVFTVGIILSDVLRYYFPHRRPHWRQLSIAAELLVLFAACFLPHSMDVAANALISFGCGLQVESFRSFRGNVIATTMCIGNMRSGTFYLDRYVLSREREDIRRSLLYYSTILFFILGAVIEAFALRWWGDMALLFSVVLLAIVYLLMMRGRKSGPSQGNTHESPDLQKAPDERKAPADSRIAPQ